jgi:phosphonate degradation associated HDIG domain protein
MMIADVSAIFALFDRFGDEEYGEAVTQREHALQVAHFAREAGEGDALVAAALLHDVGQLLDGAGAVAEREGRDARHEIGGANLLEDLFGEEILAPIRLHVAAKRYLCAADPCYLDGLSEASARSLRLQGGPFSAREAELFERLPYAQEAIRLRRYDDLGKQVGLAIPVLDTYHDMIEALRR